jgi:hypothetical protein
VGSVGFPGLGVSSQHLHLDGEQKRIRPIRVPGWRDRKTQS